MKNIKFIPLLLICILAFASCGPVIITSRPDNPPPAWFYPNRLELVRYVYFPEYTIYFDLMTHNYLYLNNDVWIRVNVLPPQYRNIDLRRSRYVRVKGYRSDNIRDYHNENNVRRSRNTRTSTTRG